MNIYYVYVYMDPRFQIESKLDGLTIKYLPIYVGKGKNKRILSYLNESRSKWNSNEGLKSYIKKMLEDGVEPIIEKIYDNLEESDAFLIERKMIALFGRKDQEQGSLFNKTSGGNGTSGYRYSPERLEIAKEDYHLRFGDSKGMLGKKHSDESKNKMRKAKESYIISEETRMKISEKLKQNHPMKGKKHSQESLKKMSESKKGKSPSEETRRKMSEIMKGRKPSEKAILASIEAHRGMKVSDESRKKMSNARKGKSPWNKGNMKDVILQLDLENNILKEWSSLGDLKSEGFQIPNILNCCNGSRKSHKGFIWKYKSDNLIN